VDEKYLLGSCSAVFQRFAAEGCPAVLRRLGRGVERELPANRSCHGL